MDIIKLVRSLTENELEQMAAAVRDEQQNRFHIQFEQGNYPEFNDYELDCVNLTIDGRPGWIEAIKAYRDRTGVSLRASKIVCDHYRNQGENQ